MHDAKKFTHLDTVYDLNTTTFVNLSDITGMQPPILVNGLLRVLLVCKRLVRFGLLSPGGG